MASTTDTIRLGPADHGRRMTLEEFLDAETRPGCLCELARGSVEISQMPGSVHDRIIQFVLGRLLAHHRDHPGRIRRSGGRGEHRLILPTAQSVRIPDLAVVPMWRSKDPRGNRPPSLTLEVVSPGTEARERDYRTKRQEYLAYGLQKYWIVDPDERRILVLIRDGDSWVERPFADG